MDIRSNIGPCGCDTKTRYYCVIIAWASFFYTYQCNNTQPYCNVIFCSFPFTGPVHGIIAIDDGAILSGKEGCGDGGGDGSWCCHGGTEQQAEVKYVHTRTHTHTYTYTI